jgi:hypothetical protein
MASVELLEIPKDIVWLCGALLGSCVAAGVDDDSPGLISKNQPAVSSLFMCETICPIEVDEVFITLKETENCGEL